MELILSWGLEGEVLAGGVEVEWLMWESPTLAAAADGTGIEVGLPTRAQAALISPTAPACVPQDHLERVLLHDLRSRGPACVELGTALTGLENGPDHVRVTLRDAAGCSRVVTARYVVAADGAHSTVRGVLGIPMHGSHDLLAGITALIHAPLWEVLGEHRYGIYVTTHPRAGGIFLPAGPSDRWGFGYLADPGGGVPAVPREPGEELRVDLAGRIDHHWVMTADGRQSTLDLIGPGLTLFTGPRDAAWQEAAARPAGGPPMIVQRLDQMSARAMGIRAGGAMLVRPDGVPAGWWTADVEPGAVLEAAVADVPAARRTARAA